MSCESKVGACINITAQVQVRRGNGSIGFHFDKDEDAVDDHGVNVFPHLSTVTYLACSADAAPTIVVNHRAGVMCVCFVYLPCFSGAKTHSATKSLRSGEILQRTIIIHHTSVGLSCQTLKGSIRFPSCSETEVQFCRRQNHSFYCYLEMYKTIFRVYLCYFTDMISSLVRRDQAPGFFQNVTHVTKNSHILSLTAYINEN